MDNRLKGISGRVALKVIQFFGFKLDRQRGSHQQWKLKLNSGETLRVTINPKQKDFDDKTLASIIDQTGRSEKEWVSALDCI